MTSVNERLGEMRQQASRTYDDARHRMSETAGYAGEMVREHPKSSVMATFGLGFGIGILAALALIPHRREPTWLERHHLTRDDLADALSRALPRSLRR